MKDKERIEQLTNQNQLSSGTAYVVILSTKDDDKRMQVPELLSAITAYDGLEGCA